MKLVLLVSPDADLVGMLRDTLQEAGIASSLARSATDVPARVAERRPDVVVLDVEHESLRATALALVQSADPAPPVVLLVGRRPPTTGTVRRWVRIAAWLCKPFSPAEFLAVVQEALALRRPA